MSCCGGLGGGGSVAPPPVEDTGQILYDAIVAPGGVDADFALPSAAFAASTPANPIRRIWVRGGTYVETANIDMSEGSTVMDGEGGVIIDLSSGFELVAEATGARIDTGTISVTDGSPAVVGVGTTFTSLGTGVLPATTPTFILIDSLWYRVLSVTDDTNLTLLNDYEGSDMSGISFVAQEMVSEVQVSRVSLIDAPEAALGFIRVRQFTLDRVTIDNSGQTAPEISALRLEDSGDGELVRVQVTNSPSSGANWERVNGVKLSVCDFSKSFLDGFELNDCKDVICDSCSFNQNGGQGVSVQTSSRNCRWDNCTITGNNLQGVLTESTTEALIFSSCEISLNGNNSGGVAVPGLTINGAQTELTSCFVNDNASDGVNLFGESVSIIGGRYNDNGDDGITVNVSADRCRIVGIEADGNTGNGIEVGATADRTTIQASTVLNNTAGQISGTGTNPNIGNNVVA